VVRRPADPDHIAGLLLAHLAVLDGGGHGRDGMPDV
jgi:hypothetical protein